MLTNAINVLIIIDTICILAVTLKIFIEKDGYKKGVKDGIEYAFTFIQHTIKHANKDSEKDKKE